MFNESDKYHMGKIYGKSYITTAILHFFYVFNRQGDQSDWK